MFTRSAQLNFLREYRNACAGDDVPAQELVREASSAWQALTPEEKSLFEEKEYLSARLAEAGPSAIGITVGLLTAQLSDNLMEMGSKAEIWTKSTAKSKSTKGNTSNSSDSDVDQP
ncbi:uncharacterized protein LOC117585341 [Drosophila guanche]|uniref:HMG box domain-containing protein n=1 Tax=Drosophila guanche TaxID=7266 RepID=A0A3B0JQG4_DROGU|nr:uncharacterized protein LOC117585341 [Drosophila guanche]SPP82612.1 Hypothetical predicted protein [Drosophila guanche]